MVKMKLKINAKKVDKYVLNFLNKQKKTLLVNPMTVIFDVGKLLKIKQKKLISICAAVECIHSYSLIHDDLPCMDNDLFRRGKPSVHKKYGEATAVLAGNSLLTLAFEIISHGKNLLSSNKKIEIINLLSNCSGHTGIAGGQELDLKFENKKKGINQILSMQRKKTGKLFNFCFRSVAIVANKSNKDKEYFGRLGEEVGLLFQLSDDFLDLRGSKKLVGKSNLVNLIGYENSLKYAENLEKKILLKLSKHGKNAFDLINTIKFINERNF